MFLLGPQRVKVHRLKEALIAIKVKLPVPLVDAAKRDRAIAHRSVTQQIEYGSKIGKIAAENPNLTFSIIRDILVSDQEATVGEYQFG